MKPAAIAVVIVTAVGCTEPLSVPSSLDELRLGRDGLAGGDDGWVLASVSAGPGFTCGIEPDGDAYCWGGVLGSAVGSPSPIPVLVAGGHRFASVGTHHLRACGITVEGDAYCWGAGAISDGTAPTRVAGGPAFASIAVGGGHTCALTPGGEAYCWGDNSDGQLGDGTTTNRLTPTKVTGGHTFEWIDLTLFRTCARDREGRVFCWGFEGDRQIPDLAPRLVPGTLTYADFTLGFAHHCGIARDGATYCWGDNDAVTERPLRLAPTRIEGAHVFVQLSDHGAYCALDAVGDVYCWDPDSYVPVRETSGFGFTTFSGGADFGNPRQHFCALDAGGVAYCWGRNDVGQLGDGTFEDRARPTKVLRPRRDFCAC